MQLLNQVLVIIIWAALMDMVPDMCGCLGSQRVDPPPSSLSLHLVAFVNRLIIVSASRHGYLLLEFGNVTLAIISSREQMT